MNSCGPSFVIRQLSCFSGLQIKYDMSKPKGSRVVDIQVRCAKCKFPVYEPLDKSAVYKVAMTDYIAAGGAGLTVIREKKLSHQFGSIVDQQMMMNYFKAKSPIMTGEENRITFVEGSDKKPTICGGGGNLQAVNMLLAPLAALASLVVKHVI